MDFHFGISFRINPASPRNRVDQEDNPRTPNTTSPTMVGGMSNPTLSSPAPFFLPEEGGPVFFLVPDTHFHPGICSRFPTCILTSAKKAPNELPPPLYLPHPNLNPAPNPNLALNPRLLLALLIPNHPLPPPPNSHPVHATWAPLVAGKLQGIWPRPGGEGVQAQPEGCQV